MVTGPATVSPPPAAMRYRAAFESFGVGMGFIAGPVEHAGGPPSPPTMAGVDQRNAVAHTEREAMLEEIRAIRREMEALRAEMGGGVEGKMGSGDA